ncbi:retrovirus-related Pol polyprotein from transposon opus [Trichonephila clavata]|uniref:RNA-directed DNA polymerase n=1 Tax=Trichonephila clavata TaxID=2740835 RepID=A0A8X6GTA2_TRICU|nr:retrovirus-related Pol polyprotein from transposon opus [Trichonephila clavata]
MTDNMKEATDYKYFKSTQVKNVVSDFGSIPRCTTLSCPLHTSPANTPIHTPKASPPGTPRSHAKRHNDGFITPPASKATRKVLVKTPDDIIIVGRDFEEHLSNLRKVLEKLKQANLKLNPDKCNLIRREVSYLGHIISPEGVRTDPRKVAAAKEWSQPQNVHELRRFLGLCTYYRRFVKGFSLIARPLHRLTEHKRPFVWTEECEVAFTSLKEALTSAPILSYPDPDKKFILDTDASHANVGAVLSQEIDGQERVIAYWIITVVTCFPATREQPRHMFFERPYRWQLKHRSGLRMYSRTGQRQYAAFTYCGRSGVETSG